MTPDSVTPEAHSNSEGNSQPSERESLLVMARDRHALQLMRQKKLASSQQYRDRLEQSQQQVLARQQRLPTIRLNADLPVSQAADRLRQAIQDHQVIIVAGETGSGKTTQLPQIALQAGRGLTGLIGHTQPRRLAARTVAERIAEELGEPLGKTVGFKVRFNETGDQNALIRLMTDGILLAELSSDRFLSRYDTLIIDEAHERSLNIDFILGYLRRLLPKRPDLKLIVTSATLDVQRFSRYFNDAPVFEVEGRSFPVEVRYRPLTEDLPKGEFIHGSDDDAFDDFEENLPRAVVRAVEECYEDAQLKGHPEHADILIFASTEQEIRELQETLHKYGPRHTEVLPLYARLALAEQQKIFHPNGKGRRIIIATNVAETALTVPNIRYVIDPGFARISRYNYRSRVQRLPIEAISQAAANQRKGRCGRIAPGVCLRLYSEADFQSRPEFTEPEIRRTNLASVILQMENLRLGDVEQFDFIEPPDHRLVNDGRKLLTELGALTEGKSGLTRTGQMMARLPIDPRLARMLIGGAHFGVLAETLIIVSALSVQDVRERPADKQTQADQKHALFREPDSDFLFFLKLWQHMATENLSENQRRSFARSHFLSWLRLREWRHTHRQLADMCQELKLSVNEQPASYENLHRALLTGLLSFIAQKTDVKGEFLAVRQQKARVFPASVLHKKQPDWLMAFEIVETTQVWLRTLAKIEPEWIISAARDLLKIHYFEPHWSKKSGSVTAWAQISLFGLIIQHKQPVSHFEKIDPEAARRIFIQEALVPVLDELAEANDKPRWEDHTELEHLQPGQAIKRHQGKAQVETPFALGVSAPFLVHNQAQIQAIQRLEDKFRRRDLLVDEAALFDFYDARIPPDVATRKRFEDWRREVESQQPQRLFMSQEHLLRDSSALSQEGETAYPERWQLGRLELPTRYRFDPNDDRDGATVTVPVQALGQLDGQQLAWGIPGWRTALIEALLKSLPKELRKKLVPIPDTATRLIPLLDPDRPQGLLVQLVAQLAGQGIRIQDFDLTQLPGYLRPTVEVIDQKKRVVAQGRDLEELQARCRTQVTAPVRQAKGELREFPAAFAFEEKRTVAGLSVSQYQALVPVDTPEGGVLLQGFGDEVTAREHHRRGVLRLLEQQLGDLARQLKKQLPKALILAFAPLGDKARLERLLITATLDATFLPEAADLPLSASAFSSLWTQRKGQFLSMGQTILRDLTDIFAQWQQVRSKLLMLDETVFKTSIHDIEDQLDGLHLADFVFSIDVQHWREYPRYLKALNQRLERLPNNLKRDLEAVRQLDPWMEKMQGRELEPRLAQIRWAVEEWRIGLFAQPMKTRYPVSAKRLEEWWKVVGG